MDRPTFQYKSKPVRAAGILVYTEHKQKKWFLFRKCKGKWADIGGKTDIADTCTLDTAIREAGEESNWHLFDEHDTPHMFTEKMRSYVEHRSTRIQYSPRAKYVTYVVRVPPHLMQNMRRFQRREREDHLVHYFRWYTKKPQPLHFRVRHIRV